MSQIRDDASRAPSVFLTVAYDGASFHGFQRQVNLDTVQEHLETALARVLRRDISISCAGRTDAGVHAFGQVVSYEMGENDPSLETIRRSVSSLMSPAVVVREAWLARPGADARFSARQREYRYRIVNGRVPPVFLRDVAWWVKRPVDVARMREAAAHLLGEHDFASFCVAQSGRDKKTVRTLVEIELIETVDQGEQCLVLRIVGPAFLHSMIRIIVGTLVEVGHGRRHPDDMKRVLAARSRGVAGQTAPPHGLVLHAVTYPSEIRVPECGAIA